MDNGHVAANIVHHGPAVPVQQFAQLHIAGPPPHVAVSCKKVFNVNK